MLLLCLISMLAEPEISRDGCFYLKLASAWFERGDFQGVEDYYKPGYHIPFLYIWVIQWLMQCGLSAEAAGVGLNIVFGCILPVVCYLIASEFSADRRIPLCSALLTALNPTLIKLAVNPQREILYLFFCGWLIFFVVRGLKRMQWRCFLPAGACLALSVLTRDESLEMIWIVAMAIIVCLIAQRKNWKKYFLYSFTFFITAAVSYTGIIYLMDIPDYFDKSLIRMSHKAKIADSE